MLLGFCIVWGLNVQLFWKHTSVHLRVTELASLCAEVI
jgi:hypothetical protein